ALLSLFFFMVRRHASATLFPYTTLFRSSEVDGAVQLAPHDFVGHGGRRRERFAQQSADAVMFEDVHGELRKLFGIEARIVGDERSEEHTSELQSRGHLVCRLLLEKKKKK